MRPLNQDQIMMSETVIEARGLRKCYQEITVLDGVAVRADKGEVISILGPSGSGKSTLLRCLNVLETPDDGVLQVCGENIALRPTVPAQLRRLRTRAPMVFQHFNLWPHLTALDNVAMPPQLALGLTRRAAQSLAAEMLNKVGLGERGNYFPSHLSGGQQQRVGIARALALSPQVILFDEPTSALDPELIGDVLRVMKQLAAEQVTMIIVTHEIDFARELSDRILFLADGEVCVDGTPSEIFSSQHPRLQRFLSPRQ